MSHSGQSSRQVDFLSLREDVGESLELLPAFWNGLDGNDLYKLATRVRSLLNSPKPDSAQRGIQLALCLADALPWDSIAEYAAEWLPALLTIVQSSGGAPESLTHTLSLLDVFLGPMTRQRPEFWREVGSGSATKYGIILMDIVDHSSHRIVKQAALKSLATQLQLGPSAFRSHAPRLQKMGTRLIFEEKPFYQEAVTLLACLPQTGKGVENQAQLWLATLQLLIEEAKRAWSACSSTFLAHYRQEDVQLSMEQLPSDEWKALDEGHARLAVLLGSPPLAGVLSLFLCEATSIAVPVPIDDMVNFALEILSVQPSTPSRLATPPEATLHAAQGALLPQAHLSSMVLLAALPLQPFLGRNSDVLVRLLAVAEQSAPAVRCMAFQTIHVTGVLQALDPNSPLLIRCTRTCLAQVARLFRAPHVEHAPKVSAGQKPNKRRKMYNADQVAFRPTRALVELHADEKSACMASLLCLQYAFPYLLSYLTSEMHDLAHTTALLLTGSLEIALRSPDDELVTILLQVITSLLNSCRGTLLGLLVTRVAPMASVAINHSSMQVREAAYKLQNELCAILQPKLPPKLSLRLHVEQDHQHFEDAQFDALALEKVELTEDAGLLESQALQDVLGFADDAVRNGVSNDAREKAHRPSLSPKDPVRVGGSPGSPRLSSVGLDPVKPMRRPSTPRIGSPTAAAVSFSTISPERSSAKHQDSTSSPPGKPTTSFASYSAKAHPSPLSKSVDENRVLGLTRHDTEASVEDDEDDAIPSLDLRSSDEESDAEV